MLAQACAEKGVAAGFELPKTPSVHGSGALGLRANCMHFTGLPRRARATVADIAEYLAQQWARLVRSLFRIRRAQRLFHNFGVYLQDLALSRQFRDRLARYLPLER